MKRVLTFGVFDYFHLGHLKLLEQAAACGDSLIVAVQKDEAVCKYKPRENLFYTTEQRVHLLESLRLVDCVATYTDVDKDIQTLEFEVLALGEDQTHSGFQRAAAWALAQGKQVVRLHYTRGISSTLLKDKISRYTDLGMSIN